MKRMFEFEGTFKGHGVTEEFVAKRLGYREEEKDIKYFLRKVAPEGYYYASVLGEYGFWPMVGYCNCGHVVEHPSRAYKIEEFSSLVCPECRRSCLRWEK